LLVPKASGPCGGEGDRKRGIKKEEGGTLAGKRLRIVGGKKKERTNSRQDEGDDAQKGQGGRKIGVFLSRDSNHRQGGALEGAQKGEKKNTCLLVLD